MAEVAEAVRGSKVEVYLDGGVRRGTDVLKALALGARAVFIGRPAIWGLAYDVSNMHDITQPLSLKINEASVVFLWLTSFASNV